MPSTYASDSVKPRMRVRRSPWPAMMPETIGTIGSTHGVNASSRPERKNAPIITNTLPVEISRARPVCSETYSPPPPPPAIAPSTIEAAEASGRATSNVFVMGG